MEKEVIIHNCEENGKTSELSGETLTKIIFNNGVWEVGDRVYNPIVKYCPFCGIKLPTLKTMKVETKR